MTSIVPGGFESYARILHPAEEPQAIIDFADTLAKLPVKIY